MTFRAILPQAQYQNGLSAASLTGILGWSLFPLTNYYQGVGACNYCIIWDMCLC